MNTSDFGPGGCCVCESSDRDCVNVVLVGRHSVPDSDSQWTSGSVSDDPVFKST